MYRRVDIIKTNKLDPFISGRKSPSTLNNLKISEMHVLKLSASQLGVYLYQMSAFLP